MYEGHLDAVLGRTTREKDLGVTFSADMKVSQQCGIAASKGNQILGLIKRTITYKFQMASGQGSHWLIESPTMFSSMCSS